MKHENNIDNYFSRVKQNPPLMDIEKVHQIITEVEAKTEVEVKKGRRNLLKFTVMTTLFAVIISAVLMWPGDSIVSSIKYQDTGQIESSSKYQDTRQLGEDTNLVDNRNASNVDNRLIAMADLNKATTDVETSNSQVANNEQLAANNKEKNIESAQQSKQKPIDFDSATIQPTDGSRFILKLTDEELEKIGFEITDSSIIYEFFAFENQYKYGIVRKKCYNSETEKPLKLVDENGRRYSNIYCPLLTRNANYNITVNQRYDFYAIYTTDTYMSNVQTLALNDYLPHSAFEIENDTLLPILIPSLDDNCDQVIFWFILTDQLYRILAENHKPILDEFNTYRTAKNLYPKKDLVIYQAPFKIDETRALKLNQIELDKLGFNFLGDSTTYSGIYANYGLSFTFYYSGKISSKKTDKNIVSNENEGSLAIFATTKNGSLIGSGLLPFFMANQFKWRKDFSILIPVCVQLFDNLERDAIFWFLPTEDFFNALPDSISNDLRKEYNYITAEDKSALVQPECKYFDECKNTLKVSSFKVFPNPANNTATVSFTLPEAINGRITLVDLAGHERQLLKPQTSYAKGQHSINVDLNNVPEGIYLLTLYTNKGVQTQRVIVAR